MSAIFISHHSSEKDAARRVAAALKAAGHQSIYLDFDPERGNPPGRDWVTEIAQQLRMCQALVLLCSPESMNSRWCFYETLSAQDQGKLVYPLIVKECQIDWPIQHLQWIDLTENFRVGMNRLVDGLQREGVLGPLPGRSPFPGLEAFDEDDAPFFFGRSEEIDQAEEELRQVRRLRSHAGLILRGPSGSGKSSVLKAGLVPRLRTDDHRWVVVGPFRPRQRPVSELANALADAFAQLGKDRDRHEIEHGLRVATSVGGGVLLQEVCQDLVRMAGRPNAQVVFVVDQLEELAAASDRNAAKLFCHLTTSLDAGSLLATVRSDLMAEIDELFGPEVEFRFRRINRLSDDRIRKVIVEPSRRAGIEIEEALVDRMVADCQGHDALPMLAFVLERLHRSSEPTQRLSVARYEALGGVTGALVQEAESVYSTHEASFGEATLSELLLRMVRLSEDDTPIKRPVLLGQLNRGEVGVLEDFVTKRLLVADEGDDGRAVEIAHERLLTAWDRLSRWITNGESALRARRDLARDAAQWDAAERPADQLLPLSKIAAVSSLQLESLDSIEQALIKESEQAHKAAEVERQQEEAKARRRLRVTAIGAGAAAVIMAALAVFGLLQTQEARRQGEVAQTRAAEARENEAEATRRQLEAEAIAVTAESSGLLATNPAQALVLALEGYVMADSPTPRQSQAIADAMRSVDTRTGQAHPPFEGHTNAVGRVVFSPGGDLVASASDDGTVRLWEASTGNPVALLEGHNDWVFDVVFSPGGDLVASASSDGTVRLWEAPTGTPVATLEGHTGNANAVVFSPGGDLVASASSDGTVRLWEAPTGNSVAVLEGHTGLLFDVVFSPDGHLIASASDDGTVRLWEASTGNPVAVLEGHTSPVREVVFSPGGDLVASASVDGTVRLWEASTGNPVALLEGHTGSVDGVAISPGGDLVASASDDGTVRLWEASTGSPVALLEGHTSPVIEVVFSPGGDLVASASSDGTVRLWEAPTGNSVAVLEGHTGLLFDVVFSPDGSRVASASSDGTVRLWEASPGNSVSVLEGHTNQVREVAVSPGGDLVASASTDGTVRLWDASTGNPVALLEGHTSPVREVVFSPDGHLVASTSDDGTVRLWEAPTGNSVAVLEGHNDAVFDAVFSPDGHLVASASDDGTVRLWEAPTGNSVAHLEGHSGSVTVVVFSPGGDLVASASSDGTVRLWEAPTGNSVAVLEGHTGSVLDVVFSPGGDLVASASDDGTVRLWDASTGNPVALLEGHSSIVRGVVFSPGGDLVASASFDRTVRLWEAPTGTSVATLEGHIDWVSDVVFSPDGHLVASASDDGTVRLWEAPTGTSVATLEGHTDSVTEVVFSPNGDLIASASRDGTVRLTPRLPAVDELCQEAKPYVTETALRPYLPPGHTFVACTDLRK